MHKKAQVGTTLTWFTAIIALVIILIAYFVFFGVLTTAKKDAAIGVVYRNDFTYESMRGVEILLETPVEQYGQGLVPLRNIWFAFSVNAVDQFLDLDKLQESIDVGDCYNYFWLIKEGFGIFKQGSDSGRFYSPFDVWDDSVFFNVSDNSLYQMEINSRPLSIDFENLRFKFYSEHTC